MCQILWLAFCDTIYRKHLYFFCLFLWLTFVCFAFIFVDIFVLILAHFMAPWGLLQVNKSQLWQTGRNYSNCTSLSCHITFHWSCQRVHGGGGWRAVPLELNNTIPPVYKRTWFPSLLYVMRPLSAPVFSVGTLVSIWTKKGDDVCVVVSVLELHVLHVSASSEEHSGASVPPLKGRSCEHLEACKT